MDPTLTHSLTCRKIVHRIKFEPFPSSSTPIFQSLKTLKIVDILHLNILTFVYTSLNKLSPAIFAMFTSRVCTWQQAVFLFTWYTRNKATFVPRPRCHFCSPFAELQTPKIGERAENMKILMCFWKWSASFYTRSVHLISCQGQFKLNHNFEMIH